ncbi:MAG TPA: hypothetical protein VMF30_12780 [Pirellulales bacterium]|nr:hypothetical protein [Pirellulales bacterium]
MCGGTEFAEGKLVATPFVAFCQAGRFLPMKITGIRCQACGYLFVFAGKPEPST